MKRAYLTTKYSYMDSDGLRILDGEYCYEYNPDLESMNDAMDNRGKAVFGFQAREGHESCKAWRITREIWIEDFCSESVAIMDSAEYLDGEIIRSITAWVRNQTDLNELVLDAIFEDAGIGQWHSDYYKNRAVAASKVWLNNG